MLLSPLCLLPAGLDSPLHAALAAGDDAKASLLVKHGADLSAKLDEKKQTALHMAARHGRVEPLELTLSSGRAEVVAHFNGGATAILLAANGRHAGCLTLLIDAKANVDARRRMTAYRRHTWQNSTGTRTAPRG